MRDIADRYELGAGGSLVFDRTFLRWDRDWATANTPVNFDGEITAAELPRELLGRAQALAGRSSDWWRQVGAVAARAGQVLGAAWNHHLPDRVRPVPERGSRDAFERGIRADLSTAIHAEAALIAGAARAWHQPGRRRPLHHDVPVPGLRPAHRRGRVRPLLLRRPVLGTRRRHHPPRGGVELLWVDLDDAGPGGPVPQPSSRRDRGSHGLTKPSDIDIPLMSLRNSFGPYSHG